MNPRRLGLVLLLGVGALAAGCAMGAQTTEGLLSQAGFRELSADTPEKISHLQTLPTRKFVKRNRDGKTYYVYADPDYCKCLYVGTVQQYAQYRSLLREADYEGAEEEYYVNEEYQAP
jgi:hypothetical protein